LIDWHKWRRIFSFRCFDGHSRVPLSRSTHFSNLLHQIKRIRISQKPNCPIFGIKLLLSKNVKECIGINMYKGREDNDQNLVSNSFTVRSRWSWTWQFRIPREELEVHCLKQFYQWGYLIMTKQNKTTSSQIDKTTNSF
jgi:hypothetical protein